MDKRSNPLAANASGSDHCQQVAIEKLRCATVDQQQFPQIVADLAAFDEFEHR